MTQPTDPAPAARRGRFALILLGGMFCGSAVIRFGTDIGPALARDLGPAEGAAAVAPAPPDRAALAEMLKHLQVKEAQLEARAREVDLMLAALALAEVEYRRQTEELDAADRRLRATLATVDAAAEADLTALTAMYENMKSEEAVPLFQKMTPDFAAGFLGRMRADAAAAILAGLDPDQAYAISVLLAGRNVRAGQAPPG